MWNKLRVENYQYFENIHLPLSNLTLLTGGNSTGKTTLLRAIKALDDIDPVKSNGETTSTVSLDGGEICLEGNCDFPNINWDQTCKAMNKVIRLCSPDPVFLVGPPFDALSIITVYNDVANKSKAGSGLSSLFDVFVECSDAHSGMITILNQPETYLHPRTQSIFGMFLGLLVLANHQIIVETHSEHILNGIRKVVKRKILSPGQVALYFCQKDQVTDTDSGNIADWKHKNITTVQHILIDVFGNLDDWPKGFFDQYEKDMSEFLDIPTNKD